MCINKKRIVRLVYLCLGIIIGVGTTAEAGKITLVNPTSGTVGIMITVEGEGYTPSETVRIDLPGQFGAVQTQCNGEGSFSTSFQLGRHPAGENKFVVVGFISYALDRGTIAVKSRISLMTPTCGKVGEFITIEGDGYGSGEEISISFGENKEMKSILADGQGGFGIVFTSDEQPAGTKKIVVSGTVSKESNTTQYVLQGGIQSVNPTNGCVGTVVTVEGAGYGNNEPIRVDFGKTESIIRTTSTSNGKFSFIFTVNTQFQGRKDISVTGLLTGEKDERGFVITPNIELVTPTRGIVGSLITVVATGFGSSEPIRIDLGRTLAAGRTESNCDGMVEAEIRVSPQPGKVTRRLAVVGINSRQISFTDAFTTLPTIQINPTSGEVESNIHIHGEGFPANEPIKIDFGKVMTSAIVTSDVRQGNFDAGFKIPTHPGGKAIVKVVSLTDGEVLKEDFLVQPRIKLISPNASPSVGNVVEIQGDGFDVNELVQIDVDKAKDVASGNTDLEGNFSISFKIEPQVGGKKTYTVTGKSSNAQKSDTLSIKEKVLISPTSGHYGTVVQIEGNGYGANESVRVDFGRSTEIAKATADENGRFLTNFTVNTKAPGEVRVRVIGFHTWSVQTVSFMVVEEKKEEIKIEESGQESEETK
ncbi:MAG: hypothetical protein AB1414_00045 [bacterium]